MSIVSTCKGYVSIFTINIDMIMEFFIDIGFFGDRLDLPRPYKKVESDALTNVKNVADKVGENGGPSQTRTGDLPIMSRML